MKLDINKIDIRTIITSRRYMLFASVMVVIGLGIVIFGVIAQVGSFAELLTANNQAQNTSRALQNKVKSLQEVDYLEEFSKSPQVDLALPFEKPLLQLISGVNSVAQQSGVSLSDITTSPGKLATQSAKVALDGTTVVAAPQRIGDDTKISIDGVNVLTIGLKARGSLTQINTFLDLIEKITPITQATKFKLSLAPAVAIQPAASGSAVLQTTTDVYESELELSTYYFAQPIAVTVDTPLPSIGKKEQAFLNSLDTYQFPDYQKQQQVQGGGSIDLFGTEQ